MFANVTFQLFKIKWRQVDFNCLTKTTTPLSSISWSNLDLVSIFTFLLNSKLKSRKLMCVKNKSCDCKFNVHKHNWWKAGFYETLGTDNWPGSVSVDFNEFVVYTEHVLCTGDERPSEKGNRIIYSALHPGSCWLSSHPTKSALVIRSLYFPVCRPACTLTASHTVPGFSFSSIPLMSHRLLCWDTQVLWRP